MHAAPGAGATRGRPVSLTMTASPLDRSRGSHSVKVAVVPARATSQNVTAGRVPRTSMPATEANLGSGRGIGRPQTETGACAGVVEEREPARTPTGPAMLLQEPCAPAAQPTHGRLGRPCATAATLGEVERAQEFIGPGGKCGAMPKRLRNPARQSPARTDTTASAAASSLSVKP